MKSATSIFSVNVVNRATSFIVYALVARSLGVEDFGNLALGTTFLFLFGRFAVLGLEPLIVREVARDQDTSSTNLAHALVLVGLAGVVALAAGRLSVVVLGYEAGTRDVVSLVLLAVIPFAATRVTEAMFIVRERTKSLAIVTIPLYLLQAAVAWWLLTRGHGVTAVAATVPAMYVVIVLVHLVSLNRAGVSPIARLKVTVAVDLLRKTMPFLGIQAMIALRAGVMPLVVATFLDAAAVGIFAAASQILVPFQMVTEASSLSLFPVLVRRFEQGMERLASVARTAIEALLVIAVPATIGLLILSSDVIELVFGDQGFAESGIVLRIIVCTIPATAVVSILGQVLWASDKEMASLRILTILVLATLVFGVGLVAPFGVVGAAWATLAVGALSVVQHAWPLRPEIGLFSLLAGSWRAALAGLIMLVAIYPARSMGLLRVVPLGVLVFAAAVLFLYAFDPRVRRLLSDRRRRSEMGDRP